MGGPVLELVARAAAEGAGDVFERMTHLRPRASLDGGPNMKGNWVSGIVGLGSETVRISLVLHVPLALARDLTERLLGQAPGSLGPDGRYVLDAVGELANMIAGRVKNQVGDEATQLLISLPAVVEGHEFTIAQGGKGSRFRYRLQFASGACWLEGAVIEQGQSTRTLAA